MTGPNRSEGLVRPRRRPDLRRSAASLVLLAFAALVLAWMRWPPHGALLPLRPPGS